MEAGTPSATWMLRSVETPRQSEAVRLEDRRNAIGSQRTSPGKISSPTLIGRDRELRLILPIVASASALVLIEHEAGVGKTRFVNELLASPRLARQHWLLGRCVELSEPFPMGALLEALRHAPVPADLPPVVGALSVHSCLGWPRVTYPSPDATSGFVSLHTEAWDAAGNRVVQVIHNAFGLKPLS